jgi:hypothetical protein
MKTADLLDEIQKLPVSERLYLIERSMQLMRKQEEAKQMESVAEQLYVDYVSDTELTAFTNLDFENFYEAR